MTSICHTTWKFPSWKFHSFFFFDIQSTKHFCFSLPTFHIHLRIFPLLSLSLPFRYWYSLGPCLWPSFSSLPTCFFSNAICSLLLTSTIIHLNILFIFMLSLENVSDWLTEHHCSSLLEALFRDWKAKNYISQTSLEALVFVLASVKPMHYVRVAR